MKILENFLTSPINPKPKPNFKEITQDIVLDVYKKEQARSIVFTSLLPKNWKVIFAPVLSLALLITIFLVSPLSFELKTKYQIAQLEKEVSSLEQELDQDMKFDEVMEIWETN